MISVSAIVSAHPTTSPPTEDSTREDQPVIKIQELMLKRIEAITAIRFMIENELQQDSTIIAGITEKVVDLELKIKAKEEEIELLHVKRADEENQKVAQQLDLFQTEKKHLQSKIDELKKKNEAYSVEFKDLTQTIDELVDRNHKLDIHSKEVLNENRIYKENMVPVQERCEQMSETIISLTSSLKEAKLSVEKEIDNNQRLEKDKANAKSMMLKLSEKHKTEIEAWKLRLEKEVDSKVQLRNEIDSLRKALCEEQLTNMKLSTLQAKLGSAEKTITRMIEEKNDMSEELIKAHEKSNSLMKKLKKNEQTDLVETLQKEIASIRTKLCQEEQNNSELISLQAKMEETERYLTKVAHEKNKLREELGEIQGTNTMLSFEIKESKSERSEMLELFAQQKIMERRLHESEKMVARLTKDNAELQRKLADAAVFKECSINSPKEASDLSKLQLSFYKEKKKMMLRQQELEGLLIEALKERFGEENSDIMKKLDEAQCVLWGRKGENQVVAE